MKGNYYKDIDGQRIWYKGVIKADGRQIFTWKRERILADGWTEYVPIPVVVDPQPPYDRMTQHLEQGYEVIEGVGHITWTIVEGSEELSADEALEILKGE